MLMADNFTGLHQSSMAGDTLLNSHETLSLQQPLDAIRLHLVHQTHTRKYFQITGKVQA